MPGVGLVPIDQSSKSRSTTLDATPERDAIDADGPPPQTLEEFVEEVVQKGAEEAHSLERAVAWHMRSKRLTTFYPLLYPGGTRKNVCDWILALSILPAVILYPLMLAFSHVLRPLNPLLLFLDAIYWVGILLNFATAVLPSPNDILIRKPSEISRRYATTWLVPDIIASIPFYYVTCGFESECPPTSSNLFIVPVLTLLCCIRVARIARTEQARVLLLLQPRNLTKPKAPSRHAGETSLLRIAIVFFWMSHAAGCLYWYTSVAILRDGLDYPGGAVLSWGVGSDSSWVPKAAYAAYLTPELPGLEALLNSTAGGPAPIPRSAYEAYTFALMWGVLHVSGIGFNFPDDPRETTTTILVGIAAIATNATLIGFVTTTLTRINAYKAKEIQGRENVTAFLADNHVPEQLQKSIHEYYDFCGGVNRQRKTWLPSLPKALSFQLEIYMKRQMFLRVPFFQGCTVTQILALVPLVISEHMMPGRIFVREGKVMEGMYMVVRGKILLLDAAQELLSTRFVGSLVGESALIHRDRHAPWTCMTGDWSELLLLRGEDFQLLTTTHPELHQRVAFATRGKDATLKGAHNDVLASHEQQLRQQEGNMRHNSMLGGARGTTMTAPRGGRGSVLVDRLKGMVGFLGESSQQPQPISV